MPLTLKSRKSIWIALATGWIVLGACSPVENPPGRSGNTLCFAYYQQCINPIFDRLRPIDQEPYGSIDGDQFCSASGCHHAEHGTAGAFRTYPNAALIAPLDPAAIINLPPNLTPNMYKNFLSAQGAVYFGSPDESRLITKPLVEVIHGGGQVFFGRQETDVQHILYWIERPAPAGKDEFCDECNDLFDVGNTCRTSFN